MPSVESKTIINDIIRAHTDQIDGRPKCATFIRLSALSGHVSNMSETACNGEIGSFD